MSSSVIRGQPNLSDVIFVGIGGREAEDTVIPSSNIEIKSAKGGLKPMRLADGGGLYVLVTTPGSKLWRLDYRRREKADAVLNTFSAVAERLFEARKAAWVTAYQSRASRIENSSVA